MSQGRNPWSDLGSLEALRHCGAFLVRATKDASDREARFGMSWAATLAGIAFGNAGVHLPHAMSYAVAGNVKSWHCPDYPGSDPGVPHGISVVVNAPSVFRATAASSPERHAAAAVALGVSVDARAPTAEIAAVLTERLTQMMKETGVPNGLSALGYGAPDVGTLVKGALLQKRLLDNAPIAVDATIMEALFRGADHCW